MQPVSRRRFCRTALGAGGLLGLGVGSVAWNEGRRESLAVASELQSETARSTAFGAQVSITALHADRTIAARSAKAAIAELHLVDEIMSLYRPDSQLSRLNRDGVLHRPHPWLVSLLREARVISQLTGGAFDVTVQPLWNVYSDAQKAGTAAKPNHIDAARRKVDWRQVEVSPAAIRLHGECRAVTLNGIAQGFAADRALAVLRKQGIRHALVDAGEINSLGTRGDGEQWRVGIRHPRQANAHAAVAGLGGRCLATSGDYATSFSDDHTQNHLFDPRTGQSPKEFSSVSVVAPTGVRADALATALSVLDPRDGLRLLKNTPETDALFVFKDGRALATSGFVECT